jgi:hypothetical protein
MKLSIKAFCLAALGGAASLLAPASANAATVAYHGLCYPGTPEAQIIAAGHTPVALASAPNAANLSGVSILWAEDCGDLADPGVAQAVANGMTLIVHNQSGNSGWFLPGGANLVNAAGVSGADIEFTAAAPFLSGPGGVLTNTSLDNGSASNHGAKTPESLPAGSIVWATTANPAHIVTFAYTYGAGKVVYSTIPLQCYLGAQCEGVVAAVPGMKAYATNLIACSLNADCTPPPATTCASEGYTGTKLEWCKNICERNYTGSTLDMWLRRWINRYHDLPYCTAPSQPALR